MLATRAAAEGDFLHRCAITNVVEQFVIDALVPAPVGQRTENVEKRHCELLDTMHEYESFVSKAPLLHDAIPVSAMRKLAGLNLSAAQLPTFLDRPDASALEGALFDLNLLASSRECENAEKLSKAISSFITTQKPQLERSCSCLSSALVSGEPWARPIRERLIPLLRTLVSCPPIQSLVDANVEKLRRMMFSVEELEQQQKQAVADGDMKRSEALYYQKIGLQESMVALFERVLTALHDYEQQHITPLSAEVKEVHDGIRDVILGLARNNDSIHITAQGDLKRLRDELLNTRATGSEAENKYIDSLAESDKRLSANTADVEKCLKGIMELERQIRDLCETRRTLSVERLAIITEHKERRATIEAFKAFVDQHTQQLEKTVKSCAAVGEATQAMSSFVRNAYKSANDHLQAMQEELVKVRTDIHELRLQHFRELYLTLGELEYKKERNIEELDKKISYTHIQQDIAMEALNPKAKEYARVKKELLKVREDMEGQVKEIRQKETLQIEAFKPTEKFLITSGHSFVHPVQELERCNEERQQKLLEYHKLMGSSEVEQEGVSKKIVEEVLRQK